MTIEEAIKNRHAVRAYKDAPIAQDIVKRLREEVTACNNESGLHLQLVTNDKEAFNCLMARYGNFKNVANYFVLVGHKNDPQLDRKCGYYGERLVLLAQQLGLNTCWVSTSFKKSKEHMQINEGEKIACVIAVGYGETQGKGHKTKSISDVCSMELLSDTFRKGIEYALLAPSSFNQQRYKIEIVDGKGTVTPKWGLYTKIDAGIAQYHFDQAFV